MSFTLTPFMLLLRASNKQLFGPVLSHRFTENARFSRFFLRTCYGCCIVSLHYHGMPELNYHCTFYGMFTWMNLPILLSSVTVVHTQLLHQFCRLGFKLFLVWSVSQRCAHLIWKVTRQRRQHPKILNYPNEIVRFLLRLDTCRWRLTTNMSVVVDDGSHGNDKTNLDGPDNSWNYIIVEGHRCFQVTQFRSQSAHEISLNEWHRLEWMKAPWMNVRFSGTFSADWSLAFAHGTHGNEGR